MLIQDFFERYARARSEQDIDAIASQYADAFMVAGPKGARTAEKAAVVAAFPKGRDFLLALGHQVTALKTLQEVKLDDSYMLVRAQFVWRFGKPPATPIDVTVDSSFILHLGQESPQIVFQQEHEDFQEILRSSGVLANLT